MFSNATTIGPKTQIADQIFDAVFPRSLDFRIALTYEQAIRFIARIERYNEFEAGAVLKALTAVVARVIPRCQFGSGNPNDGLRDYRVEVGREGSPVIYLRRFEFFTDRPMTEDEMKMICREMELIGRADESTYEIESFGQHGRKITFRFWWD